MTTKLRVTLAQTRLHWEDKTANLAHFDRLLAGLEGRTDLILLPEMFSTGFSMAAERLAEPMGGPTMNWLAAKAAATGAAVAATWIVEENERYYNRLVWMRPDSVYQTYDKKHLFTLAGEHQHYSPGRAPLLVNWKGWRIFPLICYDLRFPVWSRNVHHYDLLIYLANWPERRAQAWKSLLVARAIENQAYTIGLNRIGEDGNGVNHSGDSAIIDYAGHTLFQASHVETVFTAELFLEKQREFREKLAFLADRDHFTLEE
jgi:omega-amidase